MNYLQRFYWLHYVQLSSIFISCTYQRSDNCFSTLWWTITQPFPLDCKQFFLSLQPKQGNSEARRSKSEQFRTNAWAFGFIFLGDTGNALVSAIQHRRFSSFLMSITFLKTAGVWVSMKMRLKPIKHPILKPTVPSKDQAAACSSLSHNLFEEASENNIQNEASLCNPWPFSVISGKQLCKTERRKTCVRESLRRL